MIYKKCDTTVALITLFVEQFDSLMHTNQLYLFVPSISKQTAVTHLHTY